MERFEPALQIQLALGRDRRSVVDSMVKIPAAGALAMLLPGALWSHHGLRHPLGDGFEGFADFVPEEVSAARITAARHQVTPELLADGVFAGSVDEVLAELRPFVAAGLRHVVIWNVGPLVAGATVADLLRQALLVRRLRRLSLPPWTAVAAGLPRSADRPQSRQSVSA
jgi:phthiodiolone/phenolphthiodiolone dimycocerosates ketoreductase